MKTEDKHRATDNMKRMKYIRVKLNKEDWDEMCTMKPKLVSMNIVKTKSNRKKIFGMAGGEMEKPDKKIIGVLVR